MTSFDELLLGVAVLEGRVEVEHGLLDVFEGRQSGDGDEAALLRCQCHALPDVAEHDVAGVMHERGRHVAEQALRTEWLTLIGLHRHCFCSVGKSVSAVHSDTGWLCRCQ